MMCATESKRNNRLFHESTDSVERGQTERRKHRRFTVPGAYCINSRGGTAFELRDLSLGGMSFLSLADWQQQPQSFFNLIIGGGAFAVRNIDCHPISCQEMHDCYRIGFKFIELSAKQRYHLAHLLLAYVKPAFFLRQTGNE